MNMIFSVADMSCGHCVKAITLAVQQVFPDARVEADLPGGQVAVSGADSPESVRNAIEQAGYTPVPVG